MTNQNVKILNYSQHQDSIHHILKLKDDTYSAIDDWSVSDTVNSKAKRFMYFYTFEIRK